MRFAAQFVISLVFLLFLFVSPSFAQTPPTNTNPDVPNNLHTWTQNVVIEVTSSLTCLITGIDPIDPTGKCLGIDTKTNKIGYVENQGGAIGMMGNLIAMTFTPPATTGDFTRYLAGNFGLTKPTFAANSELPPGSGNYPNGVGFAGLTPLLNVWTTFRNIAYLLFVLIFVIIGFAIMLRVHIDPRTVMSIENQIPKIIVALILVTFSFAIAGLLIDLMYVFVYLVINIFLSIPGIDKCAGLGAVCIRDAQTQLQGQNILQVFNNVVGFQNLVTSSSLAVSQIVRDLLGTSTQVDPKEAFGIGQIFGFMVDGIKNLIGGVIGWLAGILALLIIAIAILFSLFRLWFTLIKAYVFILIDVVFAPFWIIGGLMPGSSLSFTGWLREIGSQLLAFPATIVMFLLGAVFINLYGKTPSPDYFVPPLIGNINSPSVIGSLIGLGIILMTPTVVDMMKSALKAPKFDISQVAAAIGVGTGAVSSAPGGIEKFGRGLEATKSSTGLQRISQLYGFMKNPYK